MANEKRDLNAIKTCESLFDCCACESGGCGCAYCWTCNACDNCKDGDSEACEQIEYNN